MTGSLAVVESVHQKPVNAVRDQWEVAFARFIAHPSLPLPSPTLKPLSNSRRFYPLGGTWISTSSPTASLQITADSSVSDAVLTVCFLKKILEEHYLSKLQFTWPQVSCVSGYPDRGSRSVFVSYKDAQGRMEKFAMRFSTTLEVESFINAIEENLKDESQTEHLDHDLGSRISTQSELISSNRLPSSACREELSIVTPDDAYTPQMTASWDYEVEQHSHTQETSLSHNSQGIFPTLPPGFTSLVANCCSKAEQAEKKPRASEDIDLKSQIAKYMEDSSLHVMLTKVEQIINEIGGYMVS
ncbi:hypothetical protein SLA2020_109750 [Shorea laevis]